MLGVRFLASEFTTTNGGRIDTLGLDENGCPVIYVRGDDDRGRGDGEEAKLWTEDRCRRTAFLPIVSTVPSPASR